MKTRFLKYISNKALILILSIISSVIFLTACQDEDLNSGKIQLLSFGPTGVQHGDMIKFIGSNLDKVTSIVFEGVEVEKSQFVSQTSGLIEVVVPDAAIEGKVTLKTPEGDIISKTIISFNVPVIISSIPAEAKPGTDMTITGEFLNWIESIRFNDGIEVDEFVRQSLNELVVTVPMNAQTGYLLFSSGGTEPLTFESENELVVTIPEVTSMSPMDIKHTDNLTITGTDLDLVKSILFTGDFTETFFVSQSETQIVVEIPVGVLSGALTLNLASPVQVLTDAINIILPMGESISPKPAVPGVDNITIIGTNLDLVGELNLPAIENPIPASNFISHTATEIVLAVPEGTASGGISYTTIHGYSNNLGVTIVVPGEGPPPLAITMYDETISNGGGDWSWSTVVSDPASTEQFYSGNVSWKYETDNGGGVSAGGMSAVNATGMGVFAFSLYGGPGTEGSTVACILNDNWGNYNTVTLVEGKWTDYRIDLANYPGVDLSAVTRWTFKVESPSASVIYVDRVGFDPAGPPPLDYYIYDDAVQNSWSEWGGWGHELLDFANQEEVLVGDNSIKVTFNDQYGAVQIGSPSADVFSGYTTLSFEIYAPAAQDLIVQIGNYADTYLSIPAGWSVVELPIADLDGNADVAELRIKNNNANLPVTLYIDEIGLNH